MAKKTRKQAAAKAAKAAKSMRKTGGAKKPAAARSGRKVTAPRKVKAGARKRPAGKKIQKSFLKDVERKVAGAVTGLVDTLTDAERLHQQLDPGISNEPE